MIVDSRVGRLGSRGRDWPENMGPYEEDAILTARAEDQRRDNTILYVVKES